MIVKGDLKNLPGKVLRVNPDGSVKMMPQHEALDEALDLDADVLIKSFRIGSHVRCIEGRHEGEAGLVEEVASRRRKAWKSSMAADGSCERYGFVTDWC